MKRFSAGRRQNLVHEHIRDEAIAWFVGFCEKEIDGEGRERFERWLKASPENVRAYLQIAALWESAAQSARTRGLGVDDLIERAAAETNVVDLFSATTLHDTAVKAVASVGASVRKASLYAASLAAVIILCATGLWWRQHQGIGYATAVGEERTLTLPDSSTVELDARSGIQVSFTRSARRVRLIRGQALFRVVHNARRPFIVTTENASIRDVGTQFDVRYDGAGTVVTVLEGRVAASASADDASTSQGSGTGDILVSAGEQVRLARHLTLQPVAVNPAIATAWVQGKLVFNDAPLTEVIDAFNRYNLRPLIVDDPQLLKLHVSGTFDTTNSAQVVEFLCQRFHLVAHEGTGNIRLRRD
jgi:transmembrane sensor